MVFMTFVSLHSPVSRLMAGKPRVQEVIRRIDWQIDVSTLDRVGRGRPPPIRPLHLRQMGAHAQIHRRGHEEADSQRSHCSEHSVDHRNSYMQCERRGRNHELSAHPKPCVEVFKQSSQFIFDHRPAMMRELSQSYYLVVTAQDPNIRLFKPFIFTKPPHWTGPGVGFQTAELQS